MLHVYSQSVRHGSKGTLMPLVSLGEYWHHHHQPNGADDAEDEVHVGIAGAPDVECSAKCIFDIWFILFKGIFQVA